MIQTCKYMYCIYIFVVAYKKKLSPSNKFMLLLATVDSKADSVDQQVKHDGLLACLKSVSTSKSRAENPHKFIITCAKRKQTGWCKSA